MTTPIKQRSTIHSNNNTPYGSSKKTIRNAVAGISATRPNTENMTPSRFNRSFPPKIQVNEDNTCNIGEQNVVEGEGIQGM
jgi:hypothetical protein